MRVVADSHAILWYLNDSRRLSEKALRWLEDAVHDGGVVISAMTVPEVWMAVTRKRGPRAASRSEYELLKAALADPSIAVDVKYLTSWPDFEVAAERLRDPFDALIVATALELDLPLVSADAAIRDCGLATVIW